MKWWNLFKPSFQPFDPLFSFEWASHVSHRINFFPSSLLGSNVFPRLASDSCFCALSILKYLKRVLFFGITFFSRASHQIGVFPRLASHLFFRASHRILVFPLLVMFSCIWHWSQFSRAWYGICSPALIYFFLRQASDLLSRAWQRVMFFRS